MTDEFDEVIDPDVDLQSSQQDPGLRQHEWDIVLAVAVGGAAGAEARNALAEVMPHPATGFPWSTVLINASGCLVIGAFMVLILELTSPHRLVRPFVGTGVLGGYTTFSTFAVDTQRLLVAHRPAAALGYVLLTIVSCLAAVTAGTVLTQDLGEFIIGLRINRLRRGRHRERRSG